MTLRKRRPPPGTKGLTADGVVDAALELTERRGIEGLSMRALGDALGVEAMSLYHWFPSKEGLLDAIADRLIGKVKLPPMPAPQHWQHWMTTVAHTYRRMGLDHPRAFPLVGARRVLSPAAMTFVQRTIATHLVAGFDLRQAVRLTRSIGAFVNGVVLVETAAPALGYSSATGAAEPGLDQRQWHAALDHFARPALDGAFEYGLSCLLDGALQKLRTGEKRSGP
jgi:AcrR family transcriptional regulator